MKTGQRHKREGFRLIAIMILLLFGANIAFALPSGPQVANGQVSFSTQGNNLTVTNSPNSIINWLNFSIGGSEAVRFMQQSSASAVLNRITGQSPSQIFGLLQSNGRVFLVNPNGILFGQGSQINVNGLVASTLNIRDQDFLAGKYNFTAGSVAGSIQHQGTITTPSGGSVYLIAPNIENSGIITSPQGTVLLAAGHSVQLVDSSSPDIAVVVSAPDDQAVNLGQIIAQSGTIGIYGALISQKGIVSADSATIGENGKIIFKASQSVTLDAGSLTSAQGGGTISVLADMQNGTVNVAGTLDASAPNGGNGGFIETSGAKVQVADTAHVTTLAPYGKIGMWLLDPYYFTIGVDESGQSVSDSLSTDRTISANIDINVNDNVSWTANTLKLQTTSGGVNINAVITAYNQAKLDLEPGNGKVNFGFNSDGGFKGRVDFPGRSGTGFLTINNNPYTVINSLGAVGSTTGTDLQGMQSALSGYYALGSTIDASATSTSAWSNGAAFVPIGSSSDNAFRGTLDGLGHSINNLTIYNASAYNNVGLFGYTGTSAVIRNIGLTNVSVTGSSGSYVGGLVGCNYGSILSSYSRGAVTGGSSSYVGGVVGWNDANIDSSYSAGTVSGTGTGSNVGGLAGYNWGSGNGNITNSYNASTVTVNGDSNIVGGLVGYNSWTISSSYNAGTVTVNGNYNKVGGLAGYNSGTISSSTNNIGGTVTVTSSTSEANYVGGLVGHNDSSGSINSSSNAGAVNYYGASWSYNYVGGLVGWNDGSIGSNFGSYNTGTVTVTGTAGHTNWNYVGGLVGKNYGTIGSNSYNNGIVNVNGDYNNVGGLAGYNSGTISSSTNNIGGTVTVTSSTSDANYVGGLVGHNDSSGSINSSSNAGAVNVNGANGGNYVGGLVGGNVGSIGSNFGSYNTGTVTVTGTAGHANWNYVGGLVGKNYGTIGSNSYNNGIVNVTGDHNNISGLVGYNAGTIGGNSYNNGIVNVTGDHNNVGGLVGDNGYTGDGFIVYGSVTSSYNAGPITVIGNSNKVGGLAGQNDPGASISNCYNAGPTSASGTGNSVSGLVGQNSGIMTGCSDNQASSGTSSTPPPPPTTPPATTPPPPPTTTTTTTAPTTTDPATITASSSATTNVVSTTQTATSTVTVTPTLPTTSNQSVTAALLDSSPPISAQSPDTTITSIQTGGQSTQGSSTSSSDTGTSSILLSSSTGGGSSSSDTTGSSGSTKDSGSDKGKQDKGGTTSDKGKNDQKPKKNFCN